MSSSADDHREFDDIEGVEVVEEGVDVAGVGERELGDRPD